MITEGWRRKLQKSLTLCGKLEGRATPPPDILSPESFYRSLSCSATLRNYWNTEAMIRKT